MIEKRNPTRVEKTSEEIIRFIINNKMLPGDRLPTEEEFLKRLEVSRGTLREAIKALVARNILEIRQGAGTFISPKRGVPDDPLGLNFIYDDHRLALDMLEVRLMFEPHTAELAAANATAQQRKEIAEHPKYIESLIRRGESYADEDCRFHQMIAEASGNRVIGKLMCILHSSVSKNIEITLDTLREKNTVFYHQKIARAVNEGNVISAHWFMATHLNLLREFVLDKMEADGVETNKRQDPV
jgi:GntR family transcriptional repressor for pyruvate dehydrogenase complex